MGLSFLEYGVSNVCKLNYCQINANNLITLLPVEVFVQFFHSA